MLRSPSLIAISLAGSLSLIRADATYHPLAGGAFNQNWSNTGLITTHDDWFGVSGIVGYRGDDLTTATDPRTLTAESTVVDVNANQTAPNTFVAGGVSEFDLADPVVALAGSGTADAPYLQIHLNTAGVTGISIQYNLRDLDGSADNAIQPIALQYRVGSSGAFTDITDAYVADATEGPGRYEPGSGLMATRRVPPHPRHRHSRPSGRRVWGECHRHFAPGPRSQEVPASQNPDAIHTMTRPSVSLA